MLIVVEFTKRKVNACTTLNLRSGIHRLPYNPAYAYLQQCAGTFADDKLLFL